MFKIVTTNTVTKEQYDALKKDRDAWRDLANSACDDRDKLLLEVIKNWKRN